MRNRAGAVVGVWGLMLVLISGAMAATTTRDEYITAVEPICKANTEANERILKGVRKEIKTGRLKPAASKLMRASKALAKTVRQIRAVPKPPADKADLEHWLSYVESESELFEAASDKLKAGDQVDAQRTVVKLVNVANRANGVVLSFEFHYCLLEPARFT